MGQRRLFYLRLCLVLGGTLVPCVALEAWMRVQAWRADTKERQAWQDVRRSRTDVPSPDEEALFYQLVRVSDDDSIVYEMKPDLDVTFGGVRVATDAGGMRKLARSGGKDPGPEVRIVGLGDSFMFGWSVSAAECYLGRIDARLAKEQAGTHWQITNTAVPGYNTVMEVATLKKKVLARGTRPHLVIVGFVGNDLDLPHFIWETDDYLALSRSFLLEHLFRAMAGAERTPAQPLVAASGTLENRDPEQLPAAYRHLVGVEPFGRAMRELRNLAREHGFKVLVVAHTRAPDYLKASCRATGMPLLECGPWLEGYMREHGIQDYQGSVLTVSESDPHPSAIGHRLIAEAIYDHLQASGTWSDLAATARAQPSPGR